MWSHQRIQSHAMFRSMLPCTWDNMLHLLLQAMLAAAACFLKLPVVSPRGMTRPKYRFSSCSILEP